MELSQKEQSVQSQVSQFQSELSAFEQRLIHNKQIKSETLRLQNQLSITIAQLESVQNQLALKQAELQHSVQLFDQLKSDLVNKQQQILKSELMNKQKSSENELKTEYNDNLQQSLKSALLKVSQLEQQLEEKILAQRLSEIRITTAQQQEQQLQLKIAHINNEKAQLQIQREQNTQLQHELQIQKQNQQSQIDLINSKLDSLNERENKLNDFQSVLLEKEKILKTYSGAELNKIILFQNKQINRFKEMNGIQQINGTQNIQLQAEINSAFQDFNKQQMKNEDFASRNLRMHFQIAKKATQMEEQIKIKEEKLQELIAKIDAEINKEKMDKEVQTEIKVNTIQDKNTIDAKIKFSRTPNAKDNEFIDYGLAESELSLSTYGLKVVK
ncbi:Hypothetical_protein [Hexamita inflata]|uniref:Hypothetical_protein n=1 Tax=Hexamita inflata TaxID=28002 RepID=A0AA86R2X8_9EUKA|nr:Hypothetical protein HINF_LOCUS52867 [Hexamita inflata]